MAPVAQGEVSTRWGIILENGCEIYSDCFSCPLVKCIEEETIEVQIRKSRDAKIVELHREFKMDYDEIAERVGMSYYLVRWIISQNKNGDLEEYREGTWSKKP